VGDRVTVLKDGSSVGTRTVADVSAEDLVRMMVGRDIVADPSLRAATIESSERLRVEHLQWGDKVRDVSFAVRAGEVVGLGGVVGAGRTEIARVIFGAAPDSSGKLFLDGQETQVNSPRDAVRAGIALVPEDRRGEGLVTKFSILTNVTMAYIQKSLSWRADSALERRLASGAVKTLSVKTPSISQVVGNLSGGNQQKVVIGKWLDTDARVMIFDEPTRGVDVGAKQEINRIIRSFASKGVAVLLISSELPQLLAVSDRVLVIYDGEIVDELVGDRLTEEDVVYGATTGKGRPVL
jgi:ribose transport system ATP-binding protein